MEGSEKKREGKVRKKIKKISNNHDTEAKLRQEK